MIPVVTVFSDRRKTIAIKIRKDGTVTVHAPQGTPMARIREVVRENEDWIIKNVDKVKKQNESRLSIDTDKLRAAAKEYIPPVVEKYARIMGVRPTGVKITSAKTRHGSCSSKNSLCFSLYLMLYPKAAVDYVIVHELAHIREKNHSARFYAVIEQYMPDYKERIKLLKKAPCSDK